jgi:hypothetical protein
MVSDVATGDPNAMLCLHCARRVVSPRSVSKYYGLESHLKFRAAFTSRVKLSFARIDGLIGSNLPMNAFRDEAWWSNDSCSVHTKAWLNAGWEVEEVNLKEGYVVFKKVRNVRTRKRRKLEITHPFTPVPVHRPKSSKLYARIKNLERQRVEGRWQIRGFKQKSPYQKRLFKPDEKPR